MHLKYNQYFWKSIKMKIESDRCDSQVCAAVIARGYTPIAFKITSSSRYPLNYILIKYYNETLGK
jgi:hypothetical protein